VKRLSLTALFLLLFAGSAGAQTLTPKASVQRKSEATIDSTRSFDFLSRFNKEAYRVKVYIPRREPPPDGYPVLYVLDGNVLFATFANAVRNESQAGEIEPAVVVGIESGPGRHEADRTYDFTASDLTLHEKEIAVDLGPNPRFGGYARFYQAIQEEIKPAVRRLVHVDDKRSAVFGWSLGGLFVVHTMLTHPAAFHDYVALSPSLWRSNRIIFSEIPGFEQDVSRSNLKLNLFLGVGSLEEQLSPGMDQWRVDQKGLADELAYVRMVSNARDFAAAIEPIFQQLRLVFKFQVFDGETHNSVPWSSVNPILKFLFASPNPL
jgi:predicted alpha/beta superfamily hydrolase